jgi:hypothetical protein
MSKRHAASRRRTYGRRQHEIHERIDRRAERARPDRAFRAGQDGALDPLSFLDSPSADAPYGFAD